MRRKIEPAPAQAGGLVTASEIASYAYCPEQWRLQYGLGLEPGNRAALDAGTRHHGGKAAAEQVAGGALALGRLLLAGALLALLLAWWLRR
jgi:hypothetical protein